eukprot:COSAG02_NODE_18521_length_934_cov_1.041916_1_plen_42_part_01
MEKYLLRKSIFDYSAVLSATAHICSLVVWAIYQVGNTLADRP